MSIEEQQEILKQMKAQVAQFEQNMGTSPPASPPASQPGINQTANQPQVATVIEAPPQPALLQQPNNTLGVFNVNNSIGSNVSNTAENIQSIIARERQEERQLIGIAGKMGILKF